MGERPLLLYDGERAPRLVRAVLYDYRYATYATPAERRASGAVWVRTWTGLYFPPLSLD